MGILQEGNQPNKFIGLDRKGAPSSENEQGLVWLEKSCKTRFGGCYFYATL